MIVVRLSQRNILALLHKLCMPGSAREIIKWSEDQSGVGLPSEQVAIRVATDDEVYGARRPGEMHPDTERFVSAMTNDVTNDLFNIAPMDFEPGLMEITIPGREPFIREVVGPGRSGGVFPLRYAQHLIALEFGVKDEEVSFDMPVYDNDEDAAICGFTQDVVYGVWQGGDINDWCRADIDNPPADYNLIDTPPAMVWSSVEAAQVFINTTEEWAPREIRPYTEPE